MKRDTPRFANLPLLAIHRVRKDGECASRMGWGLVCISSKGEARETSCVPPSLCLPLRSQEE